MYFPIPRGPRHYSLRSPSRSVFVFVRWIKSLEGKNWALTLGTKFVQALARCSVLGIARLYEDIHKLHWQEFVIFWNLPTPCGHRQRNIFTLTNLLTVDVSSTNYLPRLVNINCEHPFPFCPMKTSFRKAYNLSIQSILGFNLVRFTHQGAFCAFLWQENSQACHLCPNFYTKNL